MEVLKFIAPLWWLWLLIVVACYAYARVAAQGRHRRAFSAIAQASVFDSSFDRAFDTAAKSAQLGIVETLCRILGVLALIAFVISILGLLLVIPLK